MKFIITEFEINEAIKKMGRLLTARTAIPILAGVLVEAKNDCILFTASDGSESIVHRITLSAESGTEVISEGKAVFTKDTFDVSRKLKGSVTFEVNDTNVLVSQAKTKLTFSMMDASDYPPIAVETNTKPIILTGKTFSEIVNKTTYATSKSDMRPILQAVNMNFTKEVNTFVATDSHRLSRVYTEGNPNNEEEFILSVPGSILDQALKVFDLSNDVMIIPSNQSITLMNGNTILCSRLLEGAYPDTSRLIPTEFSRDLVVNLKEFISGIELLQTLSSTGVINLTLDGLFVKLTAAGANNKGSKELAYETFEGDDDFSISFSSLYALEALKQIDSQSVRLRFNDPMRPFIIVPTTNNENNSVQLILPVRQG